MLSEAILAVAEKKAKKHGVTIDTDDLQPLKDSDVFLQTNDCPETRLGFCNRNAQKE